MMSFTAANLMAVNDALPIDTSERLALLSRVALMFRARIDLAC